MTWFKKVRPPEIIAAPKIRFLSEQKGPSEDLLKEKLGQLIGHRDTVQSAYLTRIDTGPSTAVNVALCLRTSKGAEKHLVEEIGALFATIFGAEEHLDILFLGEEQETALRAKCQPFYVRA